MGKRGIILAGVLLLVALARLRLLDFPLTRDEGDYAYMAQLWLAGVPPYTAAYDMRMPGIFAFYALILAVFGESAWGIHMGLLVVHLASAWLVFALGKKLMDATAGLTAAVCFAVNGLNPWINGAVANTEHFLLLPVLGGLLVLLNGLTSRRHVTLGAAGLLMGLAVLTKQNAASFAVFAALLVAWRARALLPAFLVGAALPLVGAYALLAASGSFESFRFWTLTYPASYLTALPVQSAWRNFSSNFPVVVGWTLGFWLLAALGASALLRRERAGFERVFLLGFLLFSFLAVVPGFYFRYQHFQLLIPAIALLAGVAVSALAAWIEARNGRGAARVTASALVALPLLAFVTGEREFLFQMDGQRASRMLFSVNPFPESVEIARFIAENSQESDTVAIFGSEPQIYFYARRRSATPFILVYEAMKPHAYARSMQEEMIETLEKVRPRYLVYVNVPLSWLAKPGAETLLSEWWMQNRERNYRQVGQIDIRSQTDTDYRWGAEVGDGTPRSRYWLSVWERKDAPPSSS